MSTQQSPSSLRAFAPAAGAIIKMSSKAAEEPQATTNEFCGCGCGCLDELTLVSATAASTRIASMAAGANRGGEVEGKR